MPVPRALLLAACCAAAAISGCSSILEPRREPASFYTLAAIAGQSAAAPSDYSIGIGPIAIPEYLNRTKVVVRTSPTSVEISEVNFWAEPLPANLSRAFEQDIREQIAPRQIVSYPWYASGAPDYQIELNVYRFELDSSGVATLSARWTIRDARAHSLIDSASMDLTEAAANDDRASGAAALSRALSRLATEVAAAMRRIPRPATHPAPIQNGANEYSDLGRG
jgi:hypothetical protein